MTEEKQIISREGLRRIDRALHELRANYPVLISDGNASGEAWLALSAEYYLESTPDPLMVFPPGEARLVLTGIRAERLGLVQDASTDIALPFSVVTAAKLLEGLIDSTAIRVSPADAEALKSHVDVATQAEKAAVALAKLAGLLPAIIVARLRLDDIPAWLETNHILRVPLADAEAYRQGLSTDMRQVSEAAVPLQWAEQVRVVAFRPHYGAVEHLAVIVGEPEKAEAPLVRVHSSCVTGDIFGSLRCDCGEQLHRSLHAMAQAGAGVLLYMSQEGRGIGIANKLRAYQLQDAGLDTLDANRELGFADDERLFSQAADILKKIGILRIRLISNNPAKIDALASHGIEVAGRESLYVPENAHNAHYLDTKRKRFGHLL